MLLLDNIKVGFECQGYKATHFSGRIPKVNSTVEFEMELEKSRKVQSGNTLNTEKLR